MVVMSKGLTNPHGESIVVAARTFWREDQVPDFGRLVKLAEFDASACAPEGRVVHNQPHRRPVAPLVITMASEYAVTARNGPYSADEANALLVARSNTLRRGAPPLRLRLDWHDGIRGQWAWMDFVADRAVCLPVTSYASASVAMNSSLQFAAVASRGEGLEPQDDLDQINLTVQRVGASGAWGQPYDWPQVNTLTDWFDITLGGAEPPAPPVTVFVPIPPFAKRVHWDYIPVNFPTPANISARWVWTTQGNVPPTGSVAEFVPVDDWTPIPGFYQGIFITGDPEEVTRVRVVWELEL